MLNTRSICKSQLYFCSKQLGNKNNNINNSIKKHKIPKNNYTENCKTSTLLKITKANLKEDLNGKV